MGSGNAAYCYHSYDSLSGNGVSSTPYYSKWKEGGLSNLSTYDENPATVGYIIPDQFGGCTSFCCAWWLRSIRSDLSYYVADVDNFGVVESDSVDIYPSGADIAPGFSLSR